MKSIVFFLWVVFISGTVSGQKTIAIRNLWTRPQIHVLFQEYTISFTIRDINRALELLNETGNYNYGVKCELDTSLSYSIELLNDTRTEYKTLLQPLIQNGVGTFLLTKGLAIIENPKHKVLKSIIMDIEDLDTGEDFAYIHFYDPKNKKLIFTGKMAVNMYNKDMGIDYY